MSGASADIPLAEPSLDDSDVAAVADAVRSGHVSTAGTLVRGFEQNFAAAVGARHAVACASGTAALHVALHIAGVDRGASVAMSDFTFIASANAAVYLGAEPVLIDSDESTWCLDPALLADWLEGQRRSGGKLPQVVEVVHTLGQPADLTPVRALCAELGVILIEDAAEALGAGWTDGELAGRHVGTIGTVGAFSFNGNKIITTGGGGMIVTDDADLAARARHLTTQAKVPDRGYLHDEVGYNYRLTNLAAALGLSQLRRLDDFVQRRRRVAARYDDAFAESCLTLPPRVDGYESTYWLYSVLVPDEGSQDETSRDDLLDHLTRQGITARALWRPLHRQPALAGVRHIGGSVGDRLFRCGISLPCGANLTVDQQDHVIEAVLGWCDAR